MADFGIIGFGALGEQLLGFLLEQEGESKKIFVFDDIATNCRNYCYPFNEYKNDDFNDLEFFVGLGYNHLQTRSIVIAELKKLKRKVSDFKHSTAYAHPSAQLNQGIIIYPNSCIDQDVIIGEGTLLNNSVTVSHNTSIGKSCFIAPGAVICGNVKIGDHCFIGASSVISNNVIIGNNCMISIGAKITKNIPSGHSYVHSKIIKGKFNLH